MKINMLAFFPVLFMSVCSKDKKEESLPALMYIIYTLLELMR